MGDAAATISNSFLRVAVMVGIERNYAREILRGVERYCVAQQAGGNPKSRNPKWHLAVFPLTDIAYSRSARTKMRQWRPDGILAQISSPSLTRFCAEFKKPVVQLMHPMANSGFPRIGLDDFAVGRQAAEYFLQKGFRSFAYCGLHELDRLDLPRLRWSELRKAGFIAAIHDFFKRLPGASVAVPQINIFPGNVSLVRARAGSKISRDPEIQIAKWLKSLPPHTAVLCGCDHWAGFLLRAAGDANLPIPDHFAVLAVDDDILFCQLVDPPLSSIMTGDARVGREAAKLLDAMLAGAAAPAEPILLAPLGVAERQSSNITTVADANVSAALDYIKRNAAENISVKTLLTHVSVNRRALELKFQRILGRSPAEEIHHVRLERLKTLLGTDLSLGEIVRQMNYSSSQYLARAFRRETGMSLTEFRRKVSRGT